jgi:phage baseplate assembly protein gpV
MGQIRIFNRPPKAFEFDKEDLVIDNVKGDIYYKDDKNRLQKIIRANDTSTSLYVKTLTATTSISSSAITSSVILAGNITASGDISASGTIIANNFQSDGQEQITIADALNITGSITASGDISASGIIIANTGSFNVIEGGVF